MPELWCQGRRACSHWFVALGSVLVWLYRRRSLKQQQRAWPAVVVLKSYASKLLSTASGFNATTFVVNGRFTFGSISQAGFTTVLQ